MNSFQNGVAKAEQEIMNKANAIGVKLGNISGYTSDRIGRYKVIEGIGPNGGDWFAVGGGETKRFKTRQQAIEHCKLSQEMD